MPHLKRRSFLQIIGAASLAPALPAMPASAAATGTATHAQMLWASLYARSGSASNFTGLANSMGVSNQAAKGVIAKAVQTNALAAQGALRLSHAPRPSTLQATPAPKAGTRSMDLDLKKLIGEDEPDGPEQDDLDANSAETEGAPQAAPQP